MQNDQFDRYISEINKAYSRGDATEHTHRPALKDLIESLRDNITATNEPKRRTDCGAPDILVSLRKRNLDFRVGYIECKDIGTNLKQEEKTEQIKKRYIPSLHNFILTNYVEFRWYTNGELRLTGTMAREGEGGIFKATEASKTEIKELLRGFLEHEPEKVTSAKELAVRMGHLAQLLRDATKKTFEREEKTGPLHTHFLSFRKVLLHGLTEDEFADMYAQAIAYGLFAAWCHIEGVTVFGKDKYAAFHGMDLKAEQLTREHAAYLLPKTNPFLRKIFGQIVGPELDDRLVWIVDDLVELLRESKIESILKGFGKKGGRSDPVVHFYETFLKEYDPELRELRGVYYTPDEVVSYIVRSIDWLLKEKFGLKRGLAEESKVKIKDENGQEKETHKVLILDPAVGTGTFLFQIIEQIYSKFKRQKGAWSGYVRDHLLPRIFGFEFMMAPYAIAHTRLGLELADLGYDFDSDERLGIYLTNTLEEAQKISENIFVQGLSEEATEANKVKKDLPIMVVLGNPPYSGHSANISWEIVNGKKVLNFIGRLLKDYYKVDGQPLGEKNPKWLQDDYVKFIRFGQWRIEQTGAGILAFINNHSYLDNPTFRGMRQQLMNVFSEIYILDLHGNLKKKEVCPDGSADINVFDIQQGVSIGIFVKKSGHQRQAKVYHADCWGSRKSKYRRLGRENVEVTAWKEIKPTKPFYRFRPSDNNLLQAYSTCKDIREIFPLHSVGVLTHRDSFAWDIEREKLKDRISDLISEEFGDEEIRVRHNIDSNLIKRRGLLRQDQEWEDKIIKGYYRAFDIRFIFYHKNAVDRGRWKVLKHMIRGKNISVIAQRQTYGLDFHHVFCANGLSDLNYISNLGGGTVFPIYLYPKGENNNFFEDSDWPVSKDGRIPNLSKEFVEELAKRIKLDFVSDGRGDFKNTFGPEDAFNYIYGVLHSPEYRSRYAEFLKIDFPRIPWPKDRGVFRKVCKIGGQLVKLHLIEAEILEDEKILPSFPKEGSRVVEKGYPKYVATAEKPEKAKVYINKDQYFEGVQPDVWEFHIGGYQVCEKWLKDRRGRELSYDDVKHYQKIVVALGETIKLMKQVDEIINTHGGWPIK